MDSMPVGHSVPALSVVLDRCAAGVGDPWSLGYRGQQMTTIIAHTLS